MEWRLFANLAEAAGSKRVDVDAGAGEFEQTIATGDTPSSANATSGPVTPAVSDISLA
jgi:hypothetical protein